jgi:hypothetical protein
MGLTKKLHRRIVKKSQELKLHRKAIRAMYAALEIYGNPAYWSVTDDTRDVRQNGIVVGVERVFKWVGPTEGPQLAQSLLQNVVARKEEKPDGNSKAKEKEQKVGDLH